VAFRRLAFALNPKHINGRPAKYRAGFPAFWTESKWISNSAFAC